jgi:hypothetical protein
MEIQECYIVHCLTLFIEKNLDKILIFYYKNFLDMTFPGHLLKSSFRNIFEAS